MGSISLGMFFLLFCALPASIILLGKRWSTAERITGVVVSVIFSWFGFFGFYLIKLLERKAA